jgi:hypothetical protein
MKPTVAQQIGMKQQQFETLFAKYQRVVYCGAYSVTGNKQEVSVVTITDGEVITVNEGKRSTGSGGRGIGIGVCVGRSGYPKFEKFQTERPAKTAGRASR